MPSSNYNSSDEPLDYCPRNGYRFIKPINSIQELLDEHNGCPSIKKNDDGHIICKEEGEKPCTAQYKFLVPRISVSPIPSDLQKPQKSIPYKSNLPPLKPKSKANL